MQIGGRSRRSTAPHVEGMYGCMSLPVSSTVTWEKKQVQMEEFAGCQNVYQKVWHGFYHRGQIKRVVALAQIGGKVFGRHYNVLFYTNIICKIVEMGKHKCPGWCSVFACGLQHSSSCWCQGTLWMWGVRTSTKTSPSVSWGWGTAWTTIRRTWPARVEWRRCAGDYNCLSEWMMSGWVGWEKWCGHLLIRLEISRKWVCFHSSQSENGKELPGNVAFPNCFVDLNINGCRIQ